MYLKFSAAFGVFLLMSQSVFATPVTLLSEDFEDGLPLSAVVASPSGGEWVTVRQHDDLIDGTGGVWYENFDNFFTEGHFLVLGDKREDLGGSNSGESSILLPFSVDDPMAFDHVTISYDWVFDTNAASGVFNHDDFYVTLLNGAGDEVATVQNVDHPDQLPGAGAGSRGTYSAMFDGALLSQPGDYGLKFTLVEYTGDFSSAVGLDNIYINAVASVPEPAMALLLGLGLLGSALSARKRLR